jgi:hypothetical protein
MRDLSEEIGEEAMTELVAAAIRGDRAYPDEDGTTDDGRLVGWEEFLDLAEQIGGSTELADVYRELVISDLQTTALDDRAGAITEYEALVAAGGTWAPPAAVRTAMSQWTFHTALDLIEEAHAALAVRDELAGVLDPLGLQPTAEVESDYQAETDISDVISDLDAQLTAATRLYDEREALAASLRTLGLDEPALTQADYEGDPIGLAGDAAALADQAAELVVADSTLDDTLDDFGLSVPALAEGAFADSPEGALGQLADEQEAAEAVIAAHRARSANDSPLDKLGELGSDADRHITDAEQALAEGDTEGAIASAGAARSAIDDWGDRGRTRALIAGLVLLVLVIALVLTIVLRRRRRRRRRQEWPAPASTPASTAAQDAEPEPAPDLAGGPAGDAPDPADAGEAVAHDPGH